jgi:hypothetical protein
VASGTQLFAGSTSFETKEMKRILSTPLLMLLIPFYLILLFLPCPEIIVYIIGQYGVFISFFTITVINQFLPLDQKLLIILLASISYYFFGPYGFFLFVFFLWPWRFKQFLETDDESEFMNHLTRLFTSIFELSVLLIPIFGFIFYIVGDGGQEVLFRLILMILSHLYVVRQSNVMTNQL